MCADNDRCCTAGLGDLLHADGVCQIITARAAILFGKRDAKHSQLSQLGDCFFGKAFLFVQFGSQRLNLILCKLAVHLTEHFVLFRQRKIHVLFS